MEKERELRVENNNKTGHTLLAVAGCVCMLSGLISFVCGNPVSGYAMSFVGLSDLGLVLYYRYEEKKNA